MHYVKRHVIRFNLFTSQFTYFLVTFRYYQRLTVDGDTVVLLSSAVTGKVSLEIALVARESVQTPISIHVVFGLAYPNHFFYASCSPVLIANETLRKKGNLAEQNNDYTKNAQQRSIYVTYACQTIMFHT